MSIINFKMLQTVLHVLAQQLRVLERQVEVRDAGSSDTGLTVTEIRVQAAKRINTKAAAREIKQAKSATLTVDKTDDGADTTEVQKGSLIVVQRGSQAQVGERGSGSQQQIVGARSSKSNISVVTQAQFAELETAVRQLQDRQLRRPTPAPHLSQVIPENMKALAAIKSGALSLPEAITTLQISSRIEATERGVERLTQLIADLVTMFGGEDGASIFQRLSKETVTSIGADKPSKTGKHASRADKKASGGDRAASVGSGSPSVERKAASKDAESITSAKSTTGDKKKSGKDTGSESKKLPSDKRSISSEKRSAPAEDVDKASIRSKSSALHVKASYFSKKQGSILHAEKSVEEKVQKGSKHGGRVSEQDLADALEDIRKEMKNQVNAIESKIKAGGDAQTHKLKVLEEKAKQTEVLEKQMEALKEIVRELTSQLNSLDAGLSSQITGFQDQLIELKLDLESGIQQAMEAANSAGGDAAALNELNNKVTVLSLEAETSALAISTLDSQLRDNSRDISALLEQLEILKEIKVDREELEDLLKDKADWKALNGMVSEVYFEAVSSDFEMKLKKFEDKFAKCELAWQDAISDLQNELNEKAEISQLEPLREYLDRKLADLKGLLVSISQVLGEPRAAGTSKRLVRDSECVSCAAPAVLAEESDSTKLPLLPVATIMGQRPPVVDGAEAAPRREPVCYAEWPKGGHKCKRYCGGSHTVMRPGVVRRAELPDSVAVQALPRRVSQAVGENGQLYYVEEPAIRVPCEPCNRPTQPEPVATADALAPLSSFAFESITDAQTIAADQLRSVLDRVHSCLKVEKSNLNDFSSRILDARSGLEYGKSIEMERKAEREAEREECRCNERGLSDLEPSMTVSWVEFQQHITYGAVPPPPKRTREVR